MPRSQQKQNRPVSLKTLAEHLGLSPATVSFVLNNSPNRSIPEGTRDRVREAARQFNYQPSLVARQLQGKGSQTVGILLPELGEGYHAQVLTGAADVLMREGYFFFTAHHRHRKDLVEEYPKLLSQRGVEGLLAIDTHLGRAPSKPTIAVAGHKHLAGVTNIIIDHDCAADLALGHLVREGHRRIVFMRGASVSSDSISRWRSIVRVARRLRVSISDNYVIRLTADLNTPELGYPGISELLKRPRDFTAVLCFNDISAIGCIRALHDAGLRVPRQVSVVGFDDIQSASFHVPSLTTIRQPLQQMGATAAKLLLKKIRGDHTDSVVKIEPELIVRESTARMFDPPIQGDAEPTLQGRDGDAAAAPPV